MSDTATNPRRLGTAETTEPHMRSEIVVVSPRERQQPVEPLDEPVER